MILPEHAGAWQTPMIALRWWYRGRRARPPCVAAALGLPRGIGGAVSRGRHIRVRIGGPCGAGSGGAPVRRRARFPRARQRQLRASDPERVRQARGAPIQGSPRCGRGSRGGDRHRSGRGEHAGERAVRHGGPGRSRAAPAVGPVGRKGVRAAPLRRHFRPAASRGTGASVPARGVAGGGVRPQRAGVRRASRGGARAAGAGTPPRGISNRRTFQWRSDRPPDTLRPCWRIGAHSTDWPAMHGGRAAEPAGPVAGRSGVARVAPRCYVFRARATTNWPSGRGARSSIWPWIGDSRLRYLSTRRRGV